MLRQSFTIFTASSVIVFSMHNQFIFSKSSSRGRIYQRLSTYKRLGEILFPMDDYRARTSGSRIGHRGDDFENGDIDTRGSCVRGH